MNHEEMYSKKQCEIFENFQLLLYYLSNILYSLIPLYQEVTKLRIAESGRYADLEDPYTQGLKKDSMYRNMTMNTFHDLQIMILKKIS